jgi:hypothetical protein
MPGSQVVNDVREFIARIMTGPSQAEDTLWNEQIASVFPDLTGDSLRTYMSNSTDFIRYGAEQEAQIVMCNLEQANAEVTKSGDLLLCGCSRLDSCNEDDEICINAVDEDDSLDSIQSRDVTLEKRGGTREFPWELTANGVQYSGKLESFPVREYFGHS